MEEKAKKLALWHTPTFRPILTHDGLDSIMRVLGFLPLPPLPSTPPAIMPWREYAYNASYAARRPPPLRADVVARPPSSPGTTAPLTARLPYPRIDGLHLLTYKAFLDAVAHYIGAARTFEMFHVRAMPFARPHDQVFEGNILPMQDCSDELEDASKFVYRDGTLDELTNIVLNNEEEKNDTNTQVDSIVLVPLQELFPRDV